MDIATHGMMGCIIAAPFLSTHPFAASLFILGNAAPDLDAFSRVFGRRAFLLFHQTFTHALPIIWLLGALLSLVFFYADFPESYSPLFLSAGMCLHSLTDVSNTFGIKILAPFSNKRYCLEWVFFIDSIVLLISIPLFSYALFALNNKEAIPTWTSIAYIATLIAYWFIKSLLRKRVQAFPFKGASSFIPSALIPWHFFTCVSGEDQAQLIKINACTGKIIQESPISIYDSDWQDELNQVKEYQTMLTLSPSYHLTQIIQKDGQYHLCCKDLRIRNFKTSFGCLDLVYAEDRTLISKVFHV